MTRYGAIALSAASLFCIAANLRSQSNAAELRLEPPEVSVGLFYSGTDIHISGEAPAVDGLAVLAAGHKQTVDLKTKGKVWGLFWMNVGEVTFEHVPSFYRLVSSARLDRLASPEALVQAGAGYAALAAGSSSKEGSRGGELYAELIKLKEREGLFGLSEGGLQTEPGPGGMVRFSCTVHLPALAPEGDYRFRLIGFRDGKVEDLAEKTLRLQEVGTVASMKALAGEHGLLYGIVAVATALAAGLLTGFLFDLGSKGSH
jgi:uncharacterized protein (TIGR02186 family)